MINYIDYFINVKPTSHSLNALLAHDAQSFLYCCNEFENFLKTTNFINLLNELGF